jgi:hypothetical protein
MRSNYSCIMGGKNINNFLRGCGELPTPLLTVNQLGCTSPLPTVNPVGGVLQHPCTVPVYKLLFIRQ